MPVATLYDTPNPMEGAISNNGTINNSPKALQGDLLSGQWLSEPPKRGNGRHIRLKQDVDQRVVVPGMADFSGAGPAGTYCRDCVHLGDEIAVQTGIDAIEKTRAGCAIWSRRMARAAPSPRRDIRLCRSCKHFAAADASPRCFIIDSAGVSHQLDQMPNDVRGWLNKFRSG